MARKLSKKDNRYLARLVTGERAPCAFCLREVDDELTYGKLYAIGDIHVHYYCCLLSCCLIQKGHDEEGLFGFMYSDILAEIERCKKHKCSYCSRPGANLGCSVGACRKQFHLPCGRERRAVSLYFGSYKSFCKQHAPRQKIPDHIMTKARLRAKGVKSSETETEDVCLICYEEVDTWPGVNTFWPQCCGKDAWFHRTCLQRMSLSAGMHYLKCPLCNDRDTFQGAVLDQGYHVPDRDAAWELEQNAFADMYERSLSCDVETCVCEAGRRHDAEHGKWDIKLCLLCGSAGAHAQCILQSENSNQVLASINQSQPTNQDQSPPNNQSEIIKQEKSFDTNTTTKVKEEIINETNKLNAPILMSYLTSGMKEITAKASNASSEMSNVSSKMSYYDISQESKTVPSSSILMSDLSSYMENLSTEMVNPSSEMSEVKSEVSKAKSEMSSANDETSKVNVEMSKVNTEVSSANPQMSNNLVERQSNMSTEASLSPEKFNVRFICKSCLPAAPADLNKLVTCIEAIIESEQAQQAQSGAAASRPLMPSRMSIRRTKRIQTRPSTSRSRVNRDNRFTDSPNVISSRQELNLPPPIRREERDGTMLKRDDNILLSPLKMLEQGLREKLQTRDIKGVLLEETVETFRKKLRRPGPLSQKRRLVDDILQGVLSYTKTMEEWSSPTKLYNASQDNTSQTEVETPKRQDVFDKENLSSVHTPNKSPRNFKTDTSKSAVKSIDDFMYFNSEFVIKSEMNDEIQETDNRVQINDKPKMYEEIHESVENHAKFVEDTEIGKLQNCNMAKETEIICRDENNTNIKDLNETTAEYKSDISESNNTKNKSTSAKCDFDSNKNDKTSTKDDTNYSKNDKSNTKHSKNYKNGNKADTNDSKNDKSKTKDAKNGTKHKRYRYSNKVNINHNKNDRNSTKHCTNDTNSTKDDKHDSKNKRYSTKDRHYENNTNDTNGSEAIESTRPLKARKCKIVSPPNTDKKQTKTRNNSIDAKEKRKLKSLSLKKPNKRNVDSVRFDELKFGFEFSHKKDLDIFKDKNNTEKNVDITSKNVETTVKDLATKIDEATIDSIIIDTLKSRRVDIQQDSSLEISENDQSVNISVINFDYTNVDSPTTKENNKKLHFVLPETPKTGYKFNLFNEKSSEKKDFMDLESFKIEYLSEVGKEIACSYKHNHENKPIQEKHIKSPLDFALDGPSVKETVNSEKVLAFDVDVGKKRKISESDLKILYKDDTDKKEEKTAKHHDKIDKSRSDKRKDKRKHRAKDKRKKKKNKKRSSENENIELTINSEKRLKMREKIKTKLAIKNQNISLKIKLNKGFSSSVSLNIESKNESRKTKIKHLQTKKFNNDSKLKQCLLQFPEGSSKEVLVKPEKEVCPIKRKYVKQKKSPDKMRQMSIQSFFKIKSDK